MKFQVQFKGHPGVEVDAETRDEAIAAAKSVRGLDGIGHEINGLLVSAEPQSDPVEAPKPKAPKHKE